MTGWIASFAAAAAAGLLARRFLFLLIRVEGRSMMNTLRDGDVLLVTRPAARRKRLKRGDVVICRFPGRRSVRRWRLPGGAEISLARQTLFVKRLVALPGETLEIREGQVFIGGDPIDESHIDMASASRSDYGPVTLGPGQYFVLGDNRGGSHDSRRAGPVPGSMLVGRAARVLLPPGRFLRRP